MIKKIKLFFLTYIMKSQKDLIATSLIEQDVNHAEVRVENRRNKRTAVLVNYPITVVTWEKCSAGTSNGWWLIGNRRRRHHRVIIRVFSLSHH
jgi:hypothetical protein